jgi:hypothetical protein
VGDVVGFLEAPDADGVVADVDGCGIGGGEVEPEFGAESVAMECDAGGGIGGAGGVEDGFCLRAVC